MAHPKAKDSILQISPYIGGEAKAPAGVRHIARLASNENPLGPSPKAVEAYKALAGELHRYPDGMAEALRQALAAHAGGVSPEQIVCGAGSDELIVLLALAYAGPGDEILSSRHGFLRYPMMGKLTGAKAVMADEINLKANIDNLLAAVTPRTRLLYLANPNNPTGSYLTKDELTHLHSRLPGHVILVLDSAYAEFVLHEDYSDGLDMVRSSDNVVMLRTFSKIYGLAALRLGWAVCPPEIADVLNRVRGPFNVTAPAQAAAIAALQDKDFVFKSVAHNNHWRPWLKDKFKALGLTVYPSAGNFLLVSFTRPGVDDAAADAENARQFLKERGVLVRQMGVYGLPDCLRMTVGTEKDNEALALELKNYIKNGR